MPDRLTPPSPGSLFITTDAVGGVWSYSLALARGLAGQGRRCVLAVLGPAADADQCSAVARIDGCTLLHTGLPLEWTLTSRSKLDALASSLMQCAAQSGAATAHLHAPALAAQPWPMPVVAVAHSCMATWWRAVRGGPPPEDIFWHHEATLSGLQAADEVIAPSASFAALLTSVYGLHRKLQIVRNGLAPLRCHTSARENFVLAAGRLWDPAKNIAVLDAAAAMMQRSVRVAGSCHGPDGSHTSFPHVMALSVLPPRQLRDAMARAAIFAAPSLYEPFGLAVLEAAQLGTPLVLSDIPTFRELWSDAAVFVAPRDPAAWAGELSALAGDGTRRLRLGAAAQRRSERYRLETMVAATVRLHGTVDRTRCRAA